MEFLVFRKSNSELFWTPLLENSECVWLLKMSETDALSDGGLLELIYAMEQKKSGLGLTSQNINLCLTLKSKQNSWKMACVSQGQGTVWRQMESMGETITQGLETM